MSLFAEICKQSNNALAGYLEILPESSLRGFAQHLARQYFKDNPSKSQLTDEEMNMLALAICRELLNEIIKKARQNKVGNKDMELDGAELFYRRALNHLLQERLDQAEKLARRAVEICPTFSDGWDLLADLLDQNEKPEEAHIARSKLKELRKGKS